MKKPLTFIGIIDTNGRVSSLSIHGNNDKGCLTVVGNLPSNAQVKPQTKFDRDILVNWLNKLEFPA
jgi:hypothetical protein